MEVPLSGSTTSGSPPSCTTRAGTTTRPLASTRHVSRGSTGSQPRLRRALVWMSTGFCAICELTLSTRYSCTQIRCQRTTGTVTRPRDPRRSDSRPVTASRLETVYIQKAFGVVKLPTSRVSLSNHTCDCYITIVPYIQSFKHYCSETN